MGIVNDTAEEIPLNDLLRGRRILVTGAGGFVGRHLMDRLATLDVQAARLGLLSDRRQQGPQHHSAAPGSHGGSSEGIPDADGLRSAIAASDPEIVIHLAARRSPERSYAYAAEAVDVNFVAAHRLMHALGEGAPNLQRLVLIGSSEEYGNAPSLPITEEQHTDPVSPYSASKAAATQFALLYHKLFALPVTVLRPFIVYGPGQAPTMFVPELIHAALDGLDFAMTAGEQTRDLMHVEDLVEAILVASVHPAAVGEIFNVCSGLEVSIASLARRIVEISGSAIELGLGRLPYRQNEVWRLVGSNAKARGHLGWRPNILLDDGLRDTIDWYREHRSTLLPSIGTAGPGQSS